jgi:hypothetical protein
MGLNPRKCTVGICELIQTLFLMVLRIKLRASSAVPLEPCPQPLWFLVCLWGSLTLIFPGLVQVWSSHLHPLSTWDYRCASLCLLGPMSCFVVSASSVFSSWAPQLCALNELKCAETTISPQLSPWGFQHQQKRGKQTFLPGCLIVVITSLSAMVRRRHASKVAPGTFALCCLMLLLYIQWLFLSCPTLCHC